MRAAYNPPKSESLPAAERSVSPQWTGPTVSRKVRALKDSHVERSDMRRIIRDICDGGPQGLHALFGGDVQSSDWRLPVANYILSGLERRAERLRIVPGLSVPSARTRPDGTDFATETHAAELREEVIRALDRISHLERQLWQQGLWLPGYGFCAWFTVPRWINGFPYMALELRDPYETYPGEFVAGGQPADVACVRQMQPTDVARLWGEDKLSGIRGVTASRQPGGGMLLQQATGGTHTGAGWENQTGAGLEVAEYWDESGTYWVLMNNEELLDFMPNLTDQPMFHVVQRVVFNKVRGEFDEVVGLQGASAKLNLLLQIATEDAVFSPFVRQTTNPGQPFEIGRWAVNDVEPGSTIDRVGTSVNPQLFMQKNSLEEQLRQTAGYPKVDDGRSPLSFATGRGINELQGATANRDAAYFDIIGPGLEHLDSIRLHGEEKLADRWGIDSKPIPGTEQTYNPSSDIAGHHTTNRKYGSMAGFDDPNKVTVGMLLRQDDIIDRQSFREEIHGITNAAQVAERVQRDNSLDALNQIMTQRGVEGDERALQAHLQVLLGHKDLHEAVEEFFNEEPEPEPQMMPGGPPPDAATAMQMLQQGPQATNTTLARITPSGPMAGVQSVGR